MSASGSVGRLFQPGDQAGERPRKDRQRDRSRGPTYDWAKRQSSVDAPGTTYLPNNIISTYRVDGLLASRALGNGTTETLAYDAAKRPITIALTGGNSLSRTYDRDGNIASEGRTLPGVTGNAESNTQTFS